MFTSTNPARQSDVVTTIPASSTEEMVAALAAAKLAQKEWAALPAPARGRIIA
ncbi:MAG: aldehyde dehydrogenase family protein, partial [Actinobacteria bacterium]|nr:aldehyde dehydrogenase family protein [Actinomycetota bacterium]